MSGINPDSKDFWRKHLMRGEKLLWFGKPLPLKWHSFGYRAVLLLLYIILLVLFGWLTIELLSPEYTMLRLLIGVALLVLTLFFASIIPVAALMLPGFCRHAITDERLLTVYTHGLLSPLSMPLVILQRPELRTARWRASEGFLDCRKSEPFTPRLRFSNYRRTDRGNELVSIGPICDVDNVYKILMSAWENRRIL